MAKASAKAIKPSAWKATWRAWIVALRLKTISASFCPVLVAFALASVSSRELDYLIPIFSLFTAFFIQIGTNLVNDAIDFRRGADDERRIGPVRLIQRGLMSEKQVHTLGITAFLLAIFAALPLMLKGGPIFLAIIAISCLCGYFYTAGKYSLAYTGLADLFVLIFFGLVLTGSVIYLETGALDISALLAGTQMGLLATTLLAINNLRDRSTDAEVNKKTLSVRFGKTFGKVEITLTTALPALLGLFWFLLDLPLAAILPLLSLPLSISLITKIWKEEPGPNYNKLLGVAGLHQLLFSLLLSLTFFMS